MKVVVTREERVPEEETPKPARRFDFSEMLSIIREVLEDAHRHAIQAEVVMVATGLAYVTLVSIIPVAAVSFVIFKSVGGLDRLLSIIQPFIVQNLAEGAGEEAFLRIQDFVQGIDVAALGAGGLVALVLTSMALFSYVETAINRVWLTEIKRSLFQRISAYWLFLSLGPLVVAIVVGVSTSQTLSLQGIVPDGAVGYLLAAALLFTIYKWVPDRRVDWPSALVGAIFTATIFQVARFGVWLYTYNVVSYSKVYGSLAFLAIMLLWIFIAWVIVLSGAALSAAIQKRIDRSSNRKPAR